MTELRWMRRSGSIDVAHLLAPPEEGSATSLCHYSFTDVEDAPYGARCVSCTTKAREMYAYLVEQPPDMVMTTIVAVVTHPNKTPSADVLSQVERALERRQRTWKFDVAVATMQPYETQNLGGALRAAQAAVAGLEPEPEAQS